MSIPTEFGPEFLNWFRQRTESFWASHQPRSFQDYVQSRVGGADWQQGTKWLGGLPDESIAAIERQWSLTFPPDYRLFLQQLHTVDRPMAGASFSGNGGSSLEPCYKPSFCNWLTDTNSLKRKFDWIAEGLEFDLQHNELWMESWGEKPDSFDAQRDRLRDVLETAPRVVPIFSHRYLVAEPAVPGNPVLSIYQSDIIVYGDNLRSYLLHEFKSILGMTASEATDPNSENPERVRQYLAIPFWGGLLAGNGQLQPD